MKALDNLRTAAQLLEITDMRPSLYEIADEIERELDERYMLLPVDADGVPFHVGETVYGEDGEVETVLGVAPDMLFRAYTEFVLPGMPSYFSHRKPTVEDVLRELVDDALDGTGRDPLLKDWSALVARYADKLREVMADE